jgi:hypothetical protein
VSVLAPPPQDELEALIPEARARQRKRWRDVVAVVALLAGGALAVYSIVNGGGSRASRRERGSSFVATTNRCGIRVAGPRILGSDGGTVYREPLPQGEVHANSIPSQVRCTPAAIWVIWFNGPAMMRELYAGARSIDRGRTWKLVFADGVKAPHGLSPYVGPWMLHGHGAYFVGSCAACSVGSAQRTVQLWVTKDGGRTFRMYRIPALGGYLPGIPAFGPTRIRVSGSRVTIWARRVVRKIDRPPFEIYAHKVVHVTVR